MTLIKEKENFNQLDGNENEPVRKKSKNNTYFIDQMTKKIVQCDQSLARKDEDRNYFNDDDEIELVQDRNDSNKFTARIKKRDPSVVKKVVIQVLDEDDDSDFVYEEVRKKNKSKKVDENNEATTSFEQTENLEITKKKKTEDFQYDGKHPVTALIELCQARGWEQPVYKMVKSWGPPHMPRFVIQVTVKNEKYLSAVPGLNKKQAKLSASVLALNALGFNFDYY